MIIEFVFSAFISQACSKLNVEAGYRRVAEYRRWIEACRKKRWEAEIKTFTETVRTEWESEHRRVEKRMRNYFRYVANGM